MEERCDNREQLQEQHIHDERVQVRHRHARGGHMLQGKRLDGQSRHHLCNECQSCGQSSRENRQPVKNQRLIICCST